MPQMTIWRIHIACWVPKATKTYSEYVILIDFTLQQWFHERPSVLRYSYFACLVITETDCVYCAVRNESLCIFRLNLNLQSTTKDVPTLTSENPQEDHSSLIFANRPILIHEPRKVSVTRHGIWQTVSRSFDLTDWLIVQRLERVLCDIKQQQFTCFTLQVQATD